MKIRAAVVNNVLEDYKIEEVELESPRVNEVLVRIVASGICHSDEAFRLGHASFVFPAIFGHEGAGIVEEVGSGVTSVKPGDHVVISYAYCGECPCCRIGKTSSCDNWPAMNFGRRMDGTAVAFDEEGKPLSTILGQSSFGEKTIVDEKSVTKIDKDFDLRLAGPLGCGFLTGAGTVLNGLKPKIGTSIAIFGVGTVGIAAMVFAKVSGCTTIIAIDIHDHRLETAKELGATHTINSKKEDVKEKIQEITGGGCDYVIDTTGITPVMKLAFDVTAQGGTYAPVAVSSKELTFLPFHELVATTRTITGVLMGNAVPQNIIPLMIDLYNKGLFPVDKLVKFYDFEDINAAANDSNTGQTIKPIIIMDKEYRP